MNGEFLVTSLGIVSLLSVVADDRHLGTMHNLGLVTHCVVHHGVLLALASGLPVPMPIPLFLAVLAVVRAQTISTSTSVPPLQWINLSTVLQGNAYPPPLKDATIGYDEIRSVFCPPALLLISCTASRNIIIFGGESQGGFAQGQTYMCVISPSIHAHSNPIIVQAQS